MNSCLTFINKNTGALLRHVHVSEPKASIRHLDVSSDGYIAVAMQVQRKACDHQRAVPLLAIQKPNGVLKEVDTPESVLQKMDDYAGNVVINTSTRIVAATSPRGNLAVFWHLETNDFLHYYSFFDVCGLAITLDSRYFVLTNSLGDVRYIDATNLQENQAMRRQFSGISFDNHLLISSTYL